MAQEVAWLRDQLQGAQQEGALAAAAAASRERESACAMAESAAREQALMCQATAAIQRAWEAERRAAAAEETVRCHGDSCEVRRVVVKCGWQL